jgi:hypothetical protein
MGVTDLFEAVGMAEVRRGAIAFVAAPRRS